ncbi:ribonuclease H-like domain-containing protein [Tanacetum coccineum]
MCKESTSETNLFLEQYKLRTSAKFHFISCLELADYPHRTYRIKGKFDSREYSNARTPQQNGVAERKNRTLIEAARTMLADSFLPKHVFGLKRLVLLVMFLNRKEFAQETEELLLQAQASSTNIVNTASTPVSTASPYGGLSFTDLTNTNQNDSEIPALEEIYHNPTDGIFTNSSYDDEGAVADFTNLEPVVNVSLIPTSRITTIQPSPKSWRSTIQQFNQKQSDQKFWSQCNLYSEALEDESWVDAMQEEQFQSNPKRSKVVKALMDIYTMLPLISNDSMGELTFFLGLQVPKQKEDGNFVKTASTPIETQKPLVKDEEASDVDAKPTEMHLTARMRIFRYLKGTIHMGLVYREDSGFEAKAFADADYADA